MVTKGRQNKTCKYLINELDLSQVIRLLHQMRLMVFIEHELFKRFA